MLFFGHAGITLGAGWLSKSAALPGGPGSRALRRLTGAFTERLDLRWLLLGSMLPDIMDKPLMLLFRDSPVGTGRTVAHTLLFVVVLLLAGLMTRTNTRAVFLTLCGASLGHLLLDSMWTMPHTLFWPALGWGFQQIDPRPFIPHLVNGLMTNPAVYIPEALGGVISLAFALHLVKSRHIRRFLLEGKA